MDYQIVEMKCPAEEDAKKRTKKATSTFSFTNVVPIPVVHTRTLVRTVLDGKRKRLAISTTGSATQFGPSVQTLVVLDWTTEPIYAVNIDTKMKYVSF